MNKNRASLCMQSWTITLKPQLLKVPNQRNQVNQIPLYILKKTKYFHKIKEYNFPKQIKFFLKGKRILIIKGKTPKHNAKEKTIGTRSKKMIQQRKKENNKQIKIKQQVQRQTIHNKVNSIQETALQELHYKEGSRWISSQLHH